MEKLNAKEMEVLKAMADAMEMNGRGFGCVADVQVEGMNRHEIGGYVRALEEKAAHALEEPDPGAICRDPRDRFFLLTRQGWEALGYTVHESLEEVGPESWVYDHHEISKDEEPSGAPAASEEAPVVRYELEQIGDNVFACGSCRCIYDGPVEKCQNCQAEYWNDEYPQPTVGGVKYEEHYVRAPYQPVTDETPVVKVVNACHLMDHLFGDEYPLWTVWCEKVAAWCEENGATHYARDRENFFVGSAVAEAHEKGLGVVVVEDLS